MDIISEVKRPLRTFMEEAKVKRKSVTNKTAEQTV